MLAISIFQSIKETCAISHSSQKILSPGVKSCKAWTFSPFSCLPVGLAACTNNHGLHIYASKVWASMNSYFRHTVMTKPYASCLATCSLTNLTQWRIQFCLQQVKYTRHQIPIRWLTWPLPNIPLIGLQQYFFCFQVIVHQRCEAPPIEVWEFGWVWADNLAWKTSEFLLLLSADTSAIKQGNQFDWQPSTYSIITPSHLEW